MANTFSVGGSSPLGTGITTQNPQSAAAQSSGLATGNQNPQSLVSTNSINVQSTGVSIPLQPASITTAAIHPTTTKSSHQTSATAFIPIAILVLLAIGSGLYIYFSSKKTVKNT